MGDKPIGERVTFLEATIPNMMDKIEKLDKTMNSFINEIRENYATKKELEAVKEEVASNKEDDITKDVAKTNNKGIIVVAIIYLVMNLGIALIGLLK